MIRLLLTSGRGPAECRIALSLLLAEIVREAADQAIGTDVVAGRDPDGHGPASTVVVLYGAAAADFARGWVGSVQWTATSPVRPHHKRKNWFVGVVELPAPPRPVRIEAREVRFEAFRAGGPGGQHQNKTESAVRAVHVPSGRAVVSREERSQHRNKAAALERLAAVLAMEGELAALADQSCVQAAHDGLERGQPARRYEGKDFRLV